MQVVKWTSYGTVEHCKVNTEVNTPYMGFDHGNEYYHDGKRKGRDLM